MSLLRYWSSDEYIWRSKEQRRKCFWVASATLTLVFVLSASTSVPPAAAQMQDWRTGRLLSAGADVLQAIMLSERQIMSVASQYAAQMDRQHTLAPTSNKYAQRLARLTARHHNEDGLRMNYAVYLSPTVNAFALADGTVRVYSGLMDIMTDEEVLGVIGHEIGHVKNNDHKDKLRTSMLTLAARKAITTVGGTVGQLAESQVGAIGEMLVNAKFSRSQETDADDYGLRFMVRHGYNPRAMATALQKLAKLSGGRSNPVQQMLSTHPDPQKRAARMMQMVEQLDKSPRARAR
jgi:putative metalloprotease